MIQFTDGMTGKKTLIDNSTIETVLHRAMAGEGEVIRQSYQAGNDGLVATSRSVDGYMVIVYHKPAVPVLGGGREILASTWTHDGDYDLLNAKER